MKFTFFYIFTANVIADNVSSSDMQISVWYFLTHFERILCTCNCVTVVGKLHKQVLCREKHTLHTKMQTCTSFLVWSSCIYIYIYIYYVMSLRPSTNIIKIVVLADSETLVLGQLSETGKLKIGIFCRLRTFTLIVSAHPYCARNSHAMSCIKRTH